jgi:signal transduction histidine kinase
MTASTPAAGALVAEMTSLIDATLQQTRSIATALHPSALDDLGLAAAIEIHVGHIARRGSLHATLDLAEVDGVVDRARAGTAYRVLQECLTNVVRHAHASAVTVRLAQVESALLLEVSDDGRGITNEQLAGTGSLGLLGMRERAAAFNGTLTVTRAAPRGTTVRLRLPLAAAAAAGRGA